MKLISFYLPQFHEIPENNDAWGNGFTEWTNVSKSVPLYWGHRQPRVPLHENYYNLLDSSTMEWQVDLAKRAGIYGFCFYHYWFNGRLVLEKPVKNLLRKKHINFHYCFAWANEPWTKTWHGAGGNKEILIPQTYGKKEEWEKHYDYFQPFFRDKRYIKENGRPVLLIYRLRNIPYFNDMIQYWDLRAKEDGYSGLFVVSMNVCREHVSKSRWVNGSVDFEPNRTKSEKLQEGSEISFPRWGKQILNRFVVKSIQYDTINRTMLKTPHEKNQFRTVFIDYDDSPRRSFRAVVTRGATPKKFGKYLKNTVQKSLEEGNNYIFINAWNEWGEGNYLEPDTRYGYLYLAEVKACMKAIYHRGIRKR
ncbi:MAG: glycosyl transferase [Lachnospiraceae bacterium]|nr:glycosyl transferase [Lachnospiraceae bacterium]